MNDNNLPSYFQGDNDHLRQLVQMEMLSCWWELCRHDIPTDYHQSAPTSPPKGPRRHFTITMPNEEDCASDADLGVRPPRLHGCTDCKHITSADKIELRRRPSNPPRTSDILLETVECLLYRVILPFSFLAPSQAQILAHHQMIVRTEGASS